MNELLAFSSAGPAAGTNAGVVGGKAAALARLVAQRFPVPPWFVILPSAQAAGMTNDLRSAIDVALATIPGPYAVRSSALDEDSAAHSFAGQLTSYLEVDARDVPERVADVWNSAFTERVRAYRASRGMSSEPTAPAVIVQSMVRADFAGVAFTADPVTGERDIVVVSAVRGTGEKLVSGDVNADTWHVRVVNGAAVILRTTISDAPTGMPIAFVQSVVLIARSASLYFGSPQDIEWAMDGDRLWLLQSRPITTLDANPAPDAPSDSSDLQLWDNSNIAESYGGITSPLTFSFARHAYEGVYRAFCHLLGVPASVIAENDGVFRGMLGLIDGRVYYNLLNWYRLIAMLPGYSLSRGFMEGMMGVRERLPPELDARVTRPAGRRLTEWTRLARSTAGIVVAFRGIERRVREFDARLAHVLRPPQPGLERMSPSELVAHYRMLENELLRRWDAPIVNDFFAMIFFGLLRTTVARWCTEASPSLHNELLCDIGDVISAEPPRRLCAMAAVASCDPALVASLCHDPVPVAMDQLARHATLGPMVARYLDDFGDRCLEELKLESPTLVDDPTTLVRGIGELARRGPATEPSASARETRELAERDAFARLAGHPLQRWLLRRILRHATARVRTRENLRFERTRVFGRVRRIVVELGKRLAADGRLARGDDIFFLEVEEALGWVEGTATTLDLRGIVAVRRAEYDRFRAAPAPPDRFTTRGAVASSPRIAHAVQATDPAATTGDARQGLGCRPGVVRGAVRVIRDPRGASLGPGEILVAERTDPGWILLFPIASGILVERGSLLSHSAIVARELGIPAIVSVPGLTTWLETGDIVEMNGATGSIVRVERVGRVGEREP
ncbi:MAG: PEP/pyruvate-binding domain-containing protein [Phycisphaerae bacterium]|nr:PEP/pyruvate-binding domain-containing protein [Phycisphaerae bacterium]